MNIGNSSIVQSIYRGIRILLGFIATSLIASKFGQYDLGYYTFIVSLVLIGGQVISLGADRLLLLQDKTQSERLYSEANTYLMILLLLSGILLGVNREYFLIFTIIIFDGSSKLSYYYLLRKNKSATAYLAQDGIWIIAFILEILLLNQVLDLSLMIVLAKMVAAIIFLILCNFRPSNSLKLFATSIHKGVIFGVDSLAEIATKNVDVILITTLGLMYELAEYGVVMRLSVMILLPSIIFNTKNTFKIANVRSTELYFLKRVTRLSFIVGLVAFGGNLLFFDRILSLWEIVTDLRLYLVLSLGALSYVAMGPNHLVLLYQGKERLNANISLLVFGLSLIFQFVALSIGTPFAFAVAYAMSMISGALIRAVMVKRIFNISVGIV